MLHSIPPAPLSTIAPIVAVLGIAILVIGKHAGSAAALLHHSQEFLGQAIEFLVLHETMVSALATVVAVSLVNAGQSFAAVQCLGATALYVFADTFAIKATAGTERTDSSNQGTPSSVMYGRYGGSRASNSTSYALTVGVTQTPAGFAAGHRDRAPEPNSTSTQQMDDRLLRPAATFSATEAPTGVPIDAARIWQCTIIAVGLIAVLCAKTPKSAPALAAPGPSAPAHTHTEFRANAPTAGLPGAAQINVASIIQNIAPIAGDDIDKRQQELQDARTMRDLLANYSPALSLPLFRPKLTGVARDLFNEIVAENGGDPNPHAPEHSERERYRCIYNTFVRRFTLSDAEIGQRAERSLRELECEEEKTEAFCSRYRALFATARGVGYFNFDLHTQVSGSGAANAERDLLTAALPEELKNEVFRRTSEHGTIEDVLSVIKSHRLQVQREERVAAHAATRVSLVHHPAGGAPHGPQAGSGSEQQHQSQHQQHQPTRPEYHQGYRGYGGHRPNTGPPRFPTWWCPDGRRCADPNCRKNHPHDRPDPNQTNPEKGAAAAGGGGAGTAGGSTGTGTGDSGQP